MNLNYSGQNVLRDWVSKERVVHRVGKGVPMAFAEHSSFVHAQAENRASICLKVKGNVS